MESERGESSTSPFGDLKERGSSEAVVSGEDIGNCEFVVEVRASFCEVTTFLISPKLLYFFLPLICISAIDLLRMQRIMMWQSILILYFCFWGNLLCINIP